MPAVSLAPESIPVSGFARCPEESFRRSMVLGAERNGAVLPSKAIGGRR
jgi:hypothetical protein